MAVGIVTGKMERCTLKSTALVAVSNRNGKTIGPVRGNPSHWRVSATLRPWSQLVHTWIWRNWCHSKRRFSIRASLNGKRTLGNIVSQPLCRDRHSNSRLVDSGPGTRLIPFTGDSIPAHILSPDVPPPLSPILVRNPTGWLVSNGRTLVAVYVGEAGEDSAFGRIGIIRQNLVFGIQTRDIVDTGRTGALQIAKAPEGAAVETSAQTGDIRLSSASGATGVLHLANDHFELTG
jgi:hypothetical protein